MKRKIILNLFLFLILLGTILFLPKVSLAQTDPTCEGGTGIETAIGCIRVLSGDQNTYLGDILGWAVGVGGGIAFLLIVYAGFMIMSSAGSPDRLKAGQELMTSAISGIVLLVLSIFVLRVIGVDILKIPGFGGEKTQKIQEGADVLPVI